MMSGSLILRAARFAEAAHRGVRRKYTDEPYINHPARVASRIAFLPDATEEMVAAAWLHDVIEDCGVDPFSLREFGPDVRGLVVELTNPSKAFPHLSRGERKRMDRDHARTMSRQAKQIKLADRADNIRGAANGPRDWAILYLSETAQLARVLSDADDSLHAELMDACKALADKLEAWRTESTKGA
jgi:(p)ppGpp synthase/HD superfamily hydrolase